MYEVVTCSQIGDTDEIYFIYLFQREIPIYVSHSSQCTFNVHNYTYIITKSRNHITIDQLKI